MKQIYPYSIQNNKYISICGKLKHRDIMEKYLGRKLLPTEIVHHIDENPLNNQIENLKIVSNHEHGLIHNPPKNYKKCNLILSNEEKINYKSESAEVFIYNKPKKMKNGSIKNYQYYMLSFRINNKVKNIHIGSVNKMTLDEANINACIIKKYLLSKHFLLN